jgi:hypothetical protein
MVAALPAFPAEAFEQYADNATVQQLRPVIETYYNGAVEAASNLSVLAKATEEAEAELEHSTSEEAVKLRNAEAIVAANEQAEVEAMRKAKEQYDAAVAAIKEQYAPNREQKLALKEARAVAIRADANRRVENVQVDKLVEAYKQQQSMVTSLLSSLNMLPDVQINIPLPSANAITSPRNYSGDGSRKISDGEKAWRPRFDAIWVNGTKVRTVESNVSGKVSTRLIDAAKDAGVSVDAIKKVLQGKIGGKVFTSAILDGEGAFSFSFDHNGKTVDMKVVPQVLNAEDDSDTTDAE